MTEQQKQHAAEVLLGTKALTGGDDPKFLPKLYVVNGKCYMFLNVARRAALGTNYPIEVLDIKDAWHIYTGLEPETLDKDSIDWDWDSTGSTFDGKLFCDNQFIHAGMVPNPIINMFDNQPNIEQVLDQPVNRLFLCIRAQNVLIRTRCNTYRDLLKFGREQLLKMRNVGRTTICEFDAEMDRVGLWNQWKYNTPIQ